MTENYNIDIISIYLKIKCYEEKSRYSVQLQRAGVCCESGTDIILKNISEHLTEQLYLVGSGGLEPITSRKLTGFVEWLYLQQSGWYRDRLLYLSSLLGMKGFFIFSMCFDIDTSEKIKTISEFNQKI